MAIIQNLEAFVQSYPAGLDSVTDLQLSQNENGRQIRFTIGGVTIPAGSVATISGTKPDGVVYSNTGTIEGADTVIFDEDVQMTAVFGTWYAKIRITNAGNTIASARVRFIIDKDPVDSGAIPSESQLDGLVAEAEEYAEAAGDAAERAAITYGSPLTAATASAMTDINRVYVYTGSESGYTYGNWYYYNGSAWVSGGVYNSAAVETDTTLTESGVPADAKATGDKIDELKDDLYQIVETTYIRGIFNADGTINTSAQGVVSDVETGSNTFIVNADCKAILSFYSGNTYLGKMNANYEMDKIAGSWGWYLPGTYNVSEYLTLYGADSIRICLVPTNGVNIPAGQENAYGQAHAEYRYYKYAPLTYVNSTFAKKHGNGNNYALLTGFCKMPVEVEYLGSLNYLQAFCKYNNCYYSIEGTHITKQDENFNIQQIAVLDTGHGNSFQLGYSHYAYAFGWDDNTVYVVDLDTLTVSDTIQLPTTGYTSGVVDEINGLIYIFQRNDYPITEASFNFIVYDYINDQTISTRKTIPFGAVQACDFLDDRIFAVNGLGNSTCPNGFRIYDLSGNILSSYVLGDFATTEPEGVCIDRDTKEVMISFIDTKVYKLI